MSLLPAISNLSIFQIGFIFLLLLSVLLFVNFIKRMGIFSKLAYSKMELRQALYLHLQFKGPYAQLTNIYQRLIKDTSAFKKFEQIGMMGISYDDPKKTEPENLRSVIGILLPVSQKEEINEFLKANPDYKSKPIQASTLLKTEIPMVNKLSFLLLPFKAIPGLKKHIAENKIQNSFEGIIELYGMPEEVIVVGVPITNHEQFNLTVYPKVSKTQ